MKSPGISITLTIHNLIVGDLTVYALIGVPLTLPGRRGVYY